MIQTGVLFRQLATLPMLAGVMMFALFSPAAGQGISFEIPEDDENYAIFLTPLGGYESLDFGFVVVGHNYAIELHSEELAILEINGVRYLDIYVTLTADPFLYLDGIQTSDVNKRFDFTLKGAYANQGAGNIGPAYRQPFSGNAIRFPLFRRPSGPPGPPPVPPHSGYVPPRESAYLFLYGGIEVPTSIQSGSYGGQITVSIEYDL